MSALRTRAAAALLMLCFVVALIATPMPAAAQTANLEAEQEFKIPAQPLDTALLAFSAQSNVQVLLWAAARTGAQSQGVSGKLRAVEALRALLKGTGLTYEKIDNATVAIVKAKASATTPTPVTQYESPGEKPALTGPVGPAPNASAATGQVAYALSEVLVTAGRMLDTDIRRTPDDAQPYVVFEQIDIERSGAQNLEQFLDARLTASTSSQTSSQTSNGLGNVSSINLRGLGVDQTLILIDGRRSSTVSAGGVQLQPDLNGIPLSAVERIEVLPTTASGIYGGGATGGVVNIILKHNYSGVQATLGYASAFDRGWNERRADLIAGDSFFGGRTSVFLSGSYSADGQLVQENRDFTQNAYNLIRANYPSVLGRGSPPLGATSNIASVPVFDPITFQVTHPDLTLKNGTSLGSSITFVPPGYAGPASDNGQALVADAGKYNTAFAQTAGGGLAGLYNAPRIKHLSGTVRQQITPWLDGYLELGTSQNDGRFAVGSSHTFDVPAAAAVNPFNQDVFVTTPLFGTDGIVRSNVTSDHADAGLIVHLPKYWNAQLDYTFDSTRLTSADPGFQLTSDADAAVQSGAINVFRDTNINRPDFSPYLTGAGSTAVKSTLNDGALRLGGPLPPLLAIVPGGAPTLSFLLEHRREVVGNQIAVGFGPVPVLEPSRWQAVDSAYGEMELPFASQRNARAGLQLLELQLAGRWDRYATTGAANAIASLLNGGEGGIPIINGVPAEPIVHQTNRLSSINPTIGMRYKPVSDVMFRASYSTGFLPPAPWQTVEDPVPTVLPPLALGFLTDPRRGNEPLGANGNSITLRSGGNPNLGPETSISRSVGMIITPHYVPGLRISADWTRIAKKDEIGTVSPFQQSILDLESFIPGLVTRDTNPATFGPYSVGPIIGLDSRLRNISHHRIDAYDFAIDYERSLGRFGDLEWSGAATRYNINESQVIPLSPIMDNTDTITGLRWRANATISWTFEGWSVAWTTRYLDAYRLYPVGQEVAFVIQEQGSESIPPQIYHDLFIGYQFGEREDASSWMGSLLSNLELSLTATDILNSSPPVDLTSGGQYSTLGDPRLGTYMLRIRKSF